MTPKTIALLATTCTIALSAAAGAVSDQQGDSTKKPSVEVDLRALYALESQAGTSQTAGQAAGQPPAAPQVIRVPFQVKQKTDYQLNNAPPANNAASGAAKQTVAAANASNVGKDSRVQPAAPSAAPQITPQQPIAAAPLLPPYESRNQPAALPNTATSQQPITRIVAPQQTPSLADTAHSANTPQPQAPKAATPTRAASLPAPIPPSNIRLPQPYTPQVAGAPILPPLTPPALPYNTAKAPIAAPAATKASPQSSSWLGSTASFIGDMFGADSASNTPPNAPNKTAEIVAPPTPVTELTPTPIPALAPPASVAAPRIAPPVPTPAIAAAPLVAETPAQASILPVPDAPPSNAANYDGYEITKNMIDTVRDSSAAPSLRQPAAEYTPPLALPVPTSAPAKKAPSEDVVLAEISSEPAAARTPLRVPSELAQPAKSAAAAPTPLPSPTKNTSAPIASAAAEPANQAAISDSEEQPWFGALKQELDNFFEDEEKAQEQSKREIAKEMAEKTLQVANAEQAPSDKVAAPSNVPTANVPTAVAKVESNALPTATPSVPTVPNPLPAVTAATSMLPSLPIGMPEKNARKPIAQEITTTEQATTAPVKITKLDPTVVIRKRQAEKLAAQAKKEAQELANAQAEENKKQLAAREAAQKQQAKEAALEEAKKQQEAEALKLAEAAKKQQAENIAREKAASEAKIAADLEAKAQAQAQAQAQAKAEAQAEKLAQAAKEKERQQAKIAAEKAAKQEAKKQAQAAKEAEIALAKRAQEAQEKQVAAAVETNDTAKDKVSTPAPVANKKVELTRDTEVADAVKKTVDAPQVIAALPSATTLVKPEAKNSANGATTLSFVGSETSLESVSTASLDAIANTLKSSDAQRLAIRAYAAAEKGQEVLARRIALARGLAVRAYLIEQGVGALRINVQSVGNEDAENTPNEVVLELKDVGGA